MRRDIIIDGRHRRWAWTLNNPTWYERLYLGTKELIYRCRYIIWQSEKGENGTSHLQGYVEFEDAVVLEVLKKRLHAEVHGEASRGSGEQNIAYCRKDERGDIEIDDRYESGVPAQGAKPYKLVEMIETGADMKDIANEYPIYYIKNYAGIKKLSQLHKEGRKGRPDIEIYYGPTGTGKTLLATHGHDGTVYSPPWPKGGRWWWPNYDGQAIIVLDEFRDQVPLWKMLKLLDFGEFYVECKGDTMILEECKIIITSNIAPGSWYDDKTEADLDPLYRRFQEFAKVYEFEEVDFDRDDTIEEKILDIEKTEMVVSFRRELEKK